METSYHSCLQVFWITLIEVGRSSLNVGGTIPWAEVLDLLSLQMQCGQLPQALANVASLSQWTVLLINEIKQILSSLSGSCQLFCHNNFKSN